jgi:hypothetical protein
MPKLFVIFNDAKIGTNRRFRETKAFDNSVLAGHIKVEDYRNLSGHNNKVKPTLSLSSSRCRRSKSVSLVPLSVTFPQENVCGQLTPFEPDAS